MAAQHRATCVAVSRPAFKIGVTIVAPGTMAEWSKALVLKTNAYHAGGSNPSRLRLGLL